MWGHQDMQPNGEDRGVGEIIDELRDVCRGLDDAGAEAATQELIELIRRQPSPVDAEDGKTAMNLLRRRRLFNLMEKLGDVLILSGQDSATVRRLYAQSQLDQGNISSAIRVLKQLQTDCAPGGDFADEDEHAEALGLLGRAFKQQYVDAGYPQITRNRESLKTAIDYYANVYEADEAHLWHGVNTFALLARALQDGVPIGDHDAERAKDIAGQLEQALKNLDANQNLRHWDIATGIELYSGLAEMAENEELRDNYLEQACAYLERYSKNDNADAFELASTLRQLEEVWGLDPDSPHGSHILPSLEVALLSRDGGSMVGSAEALNAALSTDGLEKVFGAGDGIVTARWIDHCQMRLRNVCRVASASGRTVGTGMLIAGGAFCESMAGQNYVLTNHHVVSKTDAGDMKPRQPVLHFEALGTTVEAADVVWQSPVAELDAALLAIGTADGDLPEPLTSLGTLPDPDEVEGLRTYIIGHPKGNPLSVSIHDNHMLDMDDRVLHYRTPTEPGSSGSPVFDRDWDLIALHHAGKDEMDKLHDQDGHYEANEGIRIDRIRAAIQQHMGTATMIDLGVAAAAGPVVGSTHVASAMLPSTRPGNERMRTICDLDLRSADVRDKAELEPGDIVVFRANNNWISKLISSLDGYWSHSSIYVGDGNVAHAYSSGIGVMPLETVAGYYDEGYATARPNRTAAQRAAAAREARKLAATRGAEYSGRDLGLAFAMLCRVKMRSLLDAHFGFPPDDGLETIDGLEALLTRADVEMTCSGFVYACYAAANDPAPLAIEPAPGLELRGGSLFVRKDLESAGSIDEMTIYEAMQIDDGLEGFELPNWKALKSKLGLLAEAGFGIAKNMVDGESVSIEAGVTPGDLWCSPEIAERWFLDEAGRTIASVRSEHCLI